MAFMTGEQTKKQADLSRGWTLRHILIGARIGGQYLLDI
jgi:hypothetical protein